MKQTPVQSVFMFLIKVIHKDVFQIHKEEKKEESDKNVLRRIHLAFVKGMQLRFQNTADHRTVLIWRCYDAYANIAFPVDAYFRMSEVGIYQQREIIPLERYFDDDKDAKQKIHAINRDLSKIKELLLCIEPRIIEYFK